MEHTITQQLQTLKGLQDFSSQALSFFLFCELLLLEAELQSFLQHVCSVLNFNENESIPGFNVRNKIKEAYMNINIFTL